jgi:hypothetical protein
MEIGKSAARLLAVALDDLSGRISDSVVQYLSGEPDATYSVCDIEAHDVAEAVIAELICHLGTRATDPLQRSVAANWRRPA